MVLGAGVATGDILAQTFVGPSGGTGSGSGKIGIDPTSRNLSVGTSTPRSDSKFFILASSTNNDGWAMQILQPGSQPLFIVRNDRRIGIGSAVTSSATYPVTLGGSTWLSGDLTASGDIVANTINGSFTGNMSAGNIESGSFGLYTGGGNYSFPADLGIGTSSPGYRVDIQGGQLNSSGGICINADCKTSWASLAPTNMVAFFKTACPSGWTEYTTARGRYIVGLPSSGTLEGTAGTALSNLENRETGQHSHGVTDPTHTHTQSSHDHGVTDPTHTHTQSSHDHGVTDPTHTHTQNSHGHSVTDATHNHTQNSHGHSVTDLQHNHSQNSHGHSVTDPQHTHTQSSHDHGVTDPTHTHTQNSHDHDQLSHSHSIRMPVEGSDPVAEPGNTSTSRWFPVWSSTHTDRATENTTIINVAATATNIANGTGISVGGNTATNIANGTGISVGGNTATNIAGASGISIGGVTAANTATSTALSVNGNTAANTATSTALSVNASGTTAGTNAPFVQLIACRKT